MKRLDVEPDEHTLLESIKVDRAGRNRDAIDFVSLLSDTEGPYSYMIDAPWGDGKTFFVKSVEFILNEINPSLHSTQCNLPALESVIKSFGDRRVSILPFYFNAWHYDFADDPLSALLATMAAEFERKEQLRHTDLKKRVTSIIDLGIAAFGVPVRASGLVDSFTGESLVSAFEKRDEMRSGINDLCEEALPEVAEKMVIFIDELDRCRPDFAVRLLEQTKNLFHSERVILVFSTDSVQLANAVGGMYGKGFDTTRFLERFFDTRITMTPVDGYGFVNQDNAPLTSNRFDRLVSEILNRRVFTIRDHCRIKEKLQLARDYCLNEPHATLSHMVAACSILPLLVFIEHDDMELFREITFGSNPDALFDYGKAYRTFIDNTKETLQHFWRRIPDNGDFEYTDEKCRDYLHDLCVVIYGSRSNDQEYYEARSRIDGDFSRPRIQRIYKRLIFD